MRVLNRLFDWLAGVTDKRCVVCGWRRRTADSSRCARCRRHGWTA